MSNPPIITQAVSLKELWGFKYTFKTLIMHEKYTKLDISLERS